MIRGIVQAQILRGDFHLPPEVEIIDAEADIWSRLRDLADAVIAQDAPPVPILGSLQVLARIRRDHPVLQRGIFQEGDRISQQIQAAVLPSSLRLNGGGFFLPFGDIARRVVELEGVFPDGVFMRPASGTKTFTGDVAQPGELGHFCSALRQVEKVTDDELCVVAPKAQILGDELRFWILDGEIVTRAAYGWGEAATHDLELHRGAMAILPEIIERMSCWASGYTADFARTPRGVRLVELNDLSSSGLYPGASIEALLRAMRIDLGWAS